MLEKYYGEGLDVKFNLNGRWVGHGCPVFIVAEAGSNFCGKLEWAKDLIDIAIDAGADAVKFQVWKAEELYGDTQYKKFELPREWIPDLARYCAGRTNFLASRDCAGRITFLASAFDKEAVDLLDPYVPAFKIANRSYWDLDLLTHIASKDKLAIVSRPPYLKPDIIDAIINQRKLILLHCIPNYPTELSQVELWRMDELALSGVPVGFSDHTQGHLAAVAAVARGACVIEKHFTQYRETDSPDHFFAARPNELRKYVEAIRATEELIRGNPDPVLAEEKEIKTRLKELGY